MATIRPDHLNTRQSKKYLIANPKCSCPECDSLSCFTRRENRNPCSCQKCQNSKTCLYFPSKVSTKSDLSKTVKKPMEGDDLAKERVKREITYEYDEVLRVRNVSKYTNKAMFAGDKVGGEAEKENVKHPSTEVHNVAINISHKKQCLSTAKLSTQIMNVPYENFHDYFNKVSETSALKISAYDLLNKINDAYKVCSCKICECLVGKSLLPKYKLCKCEPCNCKECMKFLSKSKLSEPLQKQIPDISCPCTRCTRSQCKGIVNKFNEPQICDCPSSNCIKDDKSYAMPCNCEPCQCLECKAMSKHAPRTFVVPTVVDSYQSQRCQCSPCECIECARYGTHSSYISEAAEHVNTHPHQYDSLNNEASIANGSKACKCEKSSKTIAKPVEKYICGYEIPTMINENKVIGSANSKPAWNNTIAMYAKIPNLYKNTRNQKECICDICECVICNCKESAVDSIKSSRLFKDPYKTQFVSNWDIKACKCFLCECQICSKKSYGKKKSKMSDTNCTCDLCDCLKCDNGIKDNNKVRSYVNIIKENCTLCKCNPCDCIKCANSITCTGDFCRCALCTCKQCSPGCEEFIYPTKKAKLMPPCTSKTEIQKHSINNKLNVSAKENFQYDKKSLKSDTVVYYKGPENYPLINRMEYELPSEESHKIYKNLTICEQDWEKNYTHSTNNGVSGSLAVNEKKYEEYNRAPVPTASELCPNSCDSGCGSFDYFTVFPQTPKNEELKNQECISRQLSYETNLHTHEDRNNFAQRFDNTGYINVFKENLGHHHHCFESDNIYYLSSNNIIRNDSMNYYNNRKMNRSNNKHIYAHQYWIKNVSVTGRDNDWRQSKQKYSINEDSRNNSTDNTNTFQDSIESMSYCQDICDHSLSSCSKQVEDLCDNEAYYESVRKTLQRTRAFSLQLMNILEKYERANNEFQSITQKLKLSHASLLSENILEELKQGADTDRLSVQSMNLKNEHVTNILHRDDLIGQETLPLSFPSHKRSNHMKKQCTPLNNSPAFNFSNDSALNVKQPEHLRDFCNISRGKTIKIINESTMLSDIKTKCVKKTIKYSTKKLKQKISKGGQSTSASTRVIKTVASTQTVLGKQNYDETVTDEEEASRNLDVLPISKKNFYLLSKPVASRRICKLPTIQCEVKQAVRTISMQTKTNENVPHRNEALQNLQFEVQKLFDMPLLQQLPYKPNLFEKQRSKLLPQVKLNDFPNLSRGTSCQTKLNHVDYVSDVNNGAMYCKSSKSCCDALKVNFLGLRRVSDHTVLVKWTAPRVRSDVTGYELLVDGRAVQNVLSPSRCVAVVTCLPHCETVLITIRTITSLTPFGHFPSSTIVYHPRIK